MLFKDGVRRGFLARIRKELRPVVLNLRRQYLNRLWGMHIERDVMVSFEAKLDMANPRGIYIGEGTGVSFKSCILSHDYARGLHLDTRIGKQCQIGAGSIIFPGVTIGDHCVVAAGSVVMKDVPSNSLVAGNPARVMERGIQTGRWGRLIREAAEPVNAA